MKKLSKKDLNYMKSVLIEMYLKNMLWVKL